MMHDEELKKVLEKWEAPTPSAALDARLWESFAQSRKRRVNWKLWGAVAACLVVAIGLSLRKPVPESRSRDPRVVTRLAGTGFQPLEDGAVTVAKVRTR